MGTEMRRIDLRGFFIVLLPLLAYVTLIFILSSRSLHTFLPGRITSGDKLIHIMEYAVLAALSVRALYYFLPNMDIKKLFVLGVLFAGLYGVSDEIHQYFVPSRYAEVYDVMADVIGALLGARLYLKFTSRFKRADVFG